MAAKQDRRRQSNDKTGQDLIGTTEAARILGVTPSTLRRWIREGRIESRRVGKKWRVRRADLSKVVEIQTGEPAAPPPEPDAVRACERAIDVVLRNAGLKKADVRAQADQIEAQLQERVTGSDPDARRLLAKLLIGAVHSMVSDLHIEPFAHRVVVRQRIDGVLTQAAELPPELARAMADEIMRWAAIEPGTRCLPHDGRFLVEFGGREIDGRVSTMPGVHGTVVALRILDRRVMLPPLDELGFEPDQLERYRDLMHRPNGLILVTGPTGSGKTTTVYGSLAELNDPTRKIMTAEDPVEYAFDGIDQAQIDESIGFGFERAAVTMLRQAPNIIFIGEVRSHEIAQLLCQAALTGHLVFSVLHTDNAVNTLTRLLDMRVKPVLVSSALRCVVAQRLVRLICSHCKTEYEPTPKDLDLLGLQGKDRKRTLYYGKGCKECNLTGYRGRTAIHELLEMTPELGHAILTEDRGALVEAARAAGWRPLREVARAKLFRGETSPEEVIRAACISSREPVI